MFALIVGGGRTGSYLARTLIEDGHEVVLLEKNPAVFARLVGAVKARNFQADGCDPEQLEKAGVANADLVVGMTGDDEDNLVVSWLAKNVYNVKRVIARVNNPRNQWLFTSEWGVDIAVSAVHIISKLIQEEATLGEIVTLLKLAEGAVSLVEMTIADESDAKGKALGDLELPKDSVLVTVLRQGKVIIPAPDTVLEALDEVLAVTSPASEPALVAAMGARKK